MISDGESKIYRIFILMSQRVNEDHCLAKRGQL